MDRHRRRIRIPALIQGTQFAFSVVDLKPFVSAFGIKRDSLPQSAMTAIVEGIGKVLGEPVGYTCDHKKVQRPDACKQENQGCKSRILLRIHRRRSLQNW